ARDKGTRERKSGHHKHRPLALERLEARELLTTYVITELQTDGGRQSKAYGINDSGATVGESQPQGIRFFHAASWDTSGIKFDLGVLGNNKFSEAEAINSTGQITGSSNYSTSPTNYHAFRYNGTMTDLGALPGGTNSYGRGINSSNTIVGYSNFNGGATDKY